MTKNSDTVIAFFYQPGITTHEASLLAKNLVRFSGHFNECLHWIFELPAIQPGAAIVPSNPNFIRFTPTIPAEAADFPYPGNGQYRILEQRVNQSNGFCFDMQLFQISFPQPSNLRGLSCSLLCNFCHTGQEK